MIYVFEDKREDVLSEFFRKAYPEDVSERFVYTNGNGAILSKVEQLLNCTHEIIVVFLDFYPTNNSITKIYSRLHYESRKNDNRVIVLPIVCAEFYLLKFLDKNNMITDKRKADIVLNFELFDDVLRSNDFTEIDIKFCTTFEKYCKLVTMKWVEDCAKTNKTQEYYTENCKCETLSNSDCISYELEQKSIDYIGQYPYVPKSTYDNEVEDSDVEEIWDVHRQLVGMFNSIADKLQPIDNTRTYRKIKTIR